MAQELDEIDQVQKLQAFTFKACNLKNAKDVNLYAKLNPEAAAKKAKEEQKQSKQNKGKNKMFQITENSKIEDTDANKN